MGIFSVSAEIMQESVPSNGYTIDGVTMNTVSGIIVDSDPTGYAVVGNSNTMSGFLVSTDGEYSFVQSGGAGITGTQPVQTSSQAQVVSTSGGMSKSSTMDIYTSLQVLGYISKNQNSVEQELRNAIIQFQRDHRLPITGVIEARTMNTAKRVMVMHSRYTQAYICEEFTRKLNKGNTGYEVFRAQKFLLDRGYKVRITGRIDQQTIPIIKAFQENYRKSILMPLGLPDPTGYWHYKTIAQANRLLDCKQFTKRVLNKVQFAEPAVVPVDLVRRVLGK